MYSIYTGIRGLKYLYAIWVHRPTGHGFNKCSGFGVLGFGVQGLLTSRAATRTLVLGYSQICLHVGKVVLHVQMAHI